MKKYIITIISVLLCCTPVHAQVGSAVCQASNINNEGLCWDEPGCGWDYDDGSCELCPAGQYNDGSAAKRCLDCLKPSDVNAEFRRGDDDFQGMTHPKECPWTIQCPIGEYINPKKWAVYEGKNGTTISCEKCGKGYTTPSDSSQSWDGEELLVLDGWGNETGNETPCQKKRFQIEVFVKYTDSTDCETKYIMYNDTTINSYKETIDFDASISLSKIIEQMSKGEYHPDTDKHAYPSEGTFTLEPYGCSFPAGTRSPTMTLENYEFKPSDDIADWDTDCSFMMTIELIQQPVVTIYYCATYPNDPSLPEGTEIANVCNKETYDRCNPNAKKISDITKYGTSESKYYTGTCDTLYATQWEYYTTPPSGRDNNPKLIDIEKPIDEPSGSAEVYLIPHFESCQDGTYNIGLNYCPDKCTPCPAGQTSTTEHDACTPCDAGTYNDTPGGTCKKCADGYFSDTGATKCSQCPTGFTPDPDATSWNDCYMTPTLDFIDNESSSKKLLFTSPRVYYRGNL